MNYLNKKTLKHIDVSGKTVFLRCDFNVPLDDNGNITDTKRIDESLKTINYLLNKNAKIILCSHLGRPTDGYVQKFSLAPVAKYLSKVLNKEIKLTKDIVGPDAQKTVSSLNNGDICMLENIRFEPGEKQNEENFAKKLASFADVYVNDAFGTCHRAHASTAGIAKYLPSVCGLLIEKELTVISKSLKSPNRPFVAIMGGAKVSDKIGVIEALLDKIDVLILGGGMSYTFTNALGYSIGDSICESDKITVAKDIMAKAKDKNVKVILPIDVKIAKEYRADAEFKIVGTDKISEGWMGLDIGPKSCRLFDEVISEAKTVIWNGPMGVFEWENFAGGTYSVAKSIAESGAVSIIGGGDSAAAVYQSGFADKITHISTGGGATLKFIEGKPLPGLEALENK